MPLPLETMHKRFLQQAEWTAQLRKQLFERASFSNVSRILEVGSGTGAVLSNLPTESGKTFHAVDIHLPSLNYSHNQNAAVEHTSSDAHFLPFASQSFDIVFCHFVLLWLKDPQAALLEMRRVTQPGGSVIAFAEPDYGGRIDHPPELKPLGTWQAEALKAQGADIDMGRKIVGLFQNAGLRDPESGVLGAQWTESNADNSELEWQILRGDLEGRISSEQLDIFSREESLARDSGNRVLYVPTFFAWGKVA